MISILGCGWLGLPLAKYLIEKGYSVKGSSRSKERMPIFEKEGIEAYFIDLSPNFNKNVNFSFFNNEILIINFPPERRPDIVDYHTKQFEILIEWMLQGTIKKVLFVSSTSVYPELNREVFETDVVEPNKESGKALQRVEEMLVSNEKFKTTVLRFGGLIGHDRHPGRFLAGKKELKNGNSPVNLIHRDDCIQIVYEIIQQQKWGEVFNACADEHPSRKQYYTEAARILGIPAPEFTDNNQTDFKIVSNKKLKDTLTYSFIFPDPRDFLKM